MTELLKSQLIIFAFLTSCIMAFAMDSITGSVTNGSAKLTWPSQVNREYTLMMSTNLSEGFTEFATLQATPPLNIWWENTYHNSRFYRISRPLVTNGLGFVSNTVTNNQILNGDFSDGLTDWTMGLAGGADALFSVIGGEMYTEIVDGGTSEWHVSLRQSGLTFSNGVTYTCNFEVRAEESRVIQLYFQGDDSGNLKRKKLGISTNMAPYSVSYTMTEPTQPVRLQLALGNSTNNVWIDKVEIVDITSVGEGSFPETRNVAHEINRRMGKGNNFMAAKSMGHWGFPKDYALLNSNYFAHCRIGYKMDEICGSAPDYQIPGYEMDHLQNMVDWCLDEGLIANIDPVHNWANGPGFIYPNDLPKLSNIWVQVATHFADYDLEKVVFEIMNEPHGNVTEIIETGLAAIRGTAGNEDRIVIVSGDGFSTRQALIDALEKDEIPSDDPFLIGTFHYYDPRSFTKMTDANYTPVWGTSNEFAQTGRDFDAVLVANTNWAIRNGTAPLPLYLGEFGVDNKADETTADRKKWLSWIRLQAEKRKISWAHWNMYGNNASSKGMGPWSNAAKTNPNLREFDADPVEALVGRYEFENGSKGGGVSAQNALAGYTGSGYIAFPSATGQGVWARVDDIYIPKTGSYVVQIHYASPVERNLRLESENDAGVNVQTIVGQAFPSTGGSNSWRTLEVAVNFEAGELSSFKVVADLDEGVNLDWVQIVE